MREYRCPTCGGEFNSIHHGACPFCGILMGKHPYHEMMTNDRFQLEKATYRQSPRGTHPPKPQIKDTRPVEPPAIRVMDIPYQAPASPSLVTPPKPKPKSEERESEIKKNKKISNTYK